MLHLDPPTLGGVIFEFFLEHDSSTQKFSEKNMESLKKMMD